MKSSKFGLSLSFAKQQLCTCITLFCTFLFLCCTIRRENAQFLVLWLTWKQRRRLSFSFPDLRYNPLEFNTRKNCQIWRIEQNGIISIKFEAARLWVTFSQLSPSLLLKLLYCCFSLAGGKRQRWGSWAEGTNRTTGLNEIKINSVCMG